MKSKIAKSRATRILESDRTGISADAEELVRRDVERLLSEYFCLKCRPRVILCGDGETVKIEINAEAKSVRRFNILK